MKKVTSIHLREEKKIKIFFYWASFGTHTNFCNISGKRERVKIFQFSKKLFILLSIFNLKESSRHIFVKSVNYYSTIIEDLFKIPPNYI